MRAAGIAVLAAWLAAPLPAQQFKLNLEHLESKAANVVDVSLNGSMLQLAARFLDGKDPDEAKVKKLVSGLQGIYVRQFEFKDAGAWAKSDLDTVRSQLRVPEWSRIVGVKSAEEGETVEVYVRAQKDKVNGVGILAASPKRLTVVNIVGPVDLDSLAELGGHFGVPALEGHSGGVKKKQ